MKQLPNIFTLLNMFFGCLAIVFALQTQSVIIYVNDEFNSSFAIPEKLSLAALCIGISALIDFMDGTIWWGGFIPGMIAGVQSWRRRSRESNKTATLLAQILEGQKAQAAQLAGLAKRFAG